MDFKKQLYFRFGGAELDCTSALSLDPLYTKAYLRRGTARMGLQKYAAAKEDYERVLSLEPQSKKAKSDLLLIEKVGVFRQTQIIIYCRPLVKSVYQN